MARITVKLECEAGGGIGRGFVRIVPTDIIDVPIECGSEAVFNVDPGLYEVIVTVDVIAGTDWTVTATPSDDPTRQGTGPGATDPIVVNPA
jgi:hypothetical protein